jgi:predicted transposase/invertase (TIGR01784 family)
MAREEGKEEGKVEEKQTIAINFLRQGLSVELVAQGTGLTIEQVQQLQAQTDQA